MTALAVGPVSHASIAYSPVALFLLSGGIGGFFLFGLLGMGTGWDWPGPAWVSPACLSLAVCGAVAAVLGAAATLALWLGIT